MKPRIGLNLVLFGANAALVLAGIQWMGCASPNDNTYHEPTTPGLYNTKGWGSMGAYWPTPGTLGTASDLDVDGTIGHPFYLSGPSALSVPTHQWSGSPEVMTGSLPPGLTMDGSGLITGIPTERGHWIVTLEEDSITANGESYSGFKQVVRFHITGSGDVNQ